MSLTSLLQAQPGVSTFVITRRPPLKPTWLHALLFVTTFFTTTALGMRYMYNFQLGRPPIVDDSDIFPYRWISENLGHLSAGLPFSLTLLSILLAHEFGHFFACRYVGVRATYPYFLPAPTLSGTAGAVIRLHTRIKSRTALILIGASGPICGFIVATITSIMGFLASRPEPTKPVQASISFSAPLLMQIIHGILSMMNPATPLLYHLVPHPMLVASWIGLLITAVNLIPAGQLDGGHIAYAISRKTYNICNNITVVTLFFLGVIFWAGWMLWGILLMMPAMKHPQVEDGPEVGPWQWALVPICVVIFILCFTLKPTSLSSIMDAFDSIRWGFWIH